MDNLNNDAYIFISAHGCLNLKDSKYDIVDLRQNHTNINVNMVTIGELGTLTPFCNFYSEFITQFNSFNTNTNNSFIKMVDFYLDNYMKNENGYHYTNEIKNNNNYPWICYPNSTELNQKYQTEYNEILKQTPAYEIDKKIDSLCYRVAENKVSMPIN